jgi:hypothetical protein
LVPAIPVQGFNRLRYRGQLSISNHKIMHIYIGYCHVMLW